MTLCAILFKSHTVPEKVTSPFALEHLAHPAERKQSKQTAYTMRAINKHLIKNTKITIKYTFSQKEREDVYCVLMCTVL